MLESHYQVSFGDCAMLNTVTSAEIVTTPTFDWLAQYAKECNSRVLIGSPYVNNGIVPLAKLIPNGVNRTLVTRTDLRDFAVGASNLDTLCNLAQDGVTIRSLSNFHAKIYVFDDKTALVTSANATHAGMYRNWECGLGTTDSEVVLQLAKTLLSGFGSDNPPRVMKLGELEALRIPLEAIKATVSKPLHVVETSDAISAPDAVFFVPDKEALLEGFGGWQRLTLRAVLEMPEAGFGMNELYAVCAPWAAKEYPKNNFVQAQLRKQLQLLRDLGLVEFVRPGEYRLTLKKNA